MAKEAPDFKITRCQGCGAEIFFAKTKDGKMVPLDRHAQVRAVLIGKPGAYEAHFFQTYTTHFATCPEADRFRKPR